VESFLLLFWHEKAGVLGHAEADLFYPLVCFVVNPGPGEGPGWFGLILFKP